MISSTDHIVVALLEEGESTKPYYCGCGSEYGIGPDTDTFIKIPGFDNIECSKIIASNSFVLVLDVEGVLYGFGDNTYNNITYNNINYNNINYSSDKKITNGVVKCFGDKKFKYVSCFDYISVGLDINNVIYYWGKGYPNLFGVQLQNMSFEIKKIIPLNIEKSVILTQDGKIIYHQQKIGNLVLENFDSPIISIIYQNYVQSLVALSDNMKFYNINIETNQKDQQIITCPSKPVDIIHNKVGTLLNFFDIVFLNGSIISSNNNFKGSQVISLFNNNTITNTSYFATKNINVVISDQNGYLYTCEKVMYKGECQLKIMKKEGGSIAKLKN